jgi:hypothetical protein
VPTVRMPSFVMQPLPVVREDELGARPGFVDSGPRMRVNTSTISQIGRFGSRWKSDREPVLVPECAYAWGTGTAVKAAVKTGSRSRDERTDHRARSSRPPGGVGGIAQLWQWVRPCGSADTDVQRAARIEDSSRAMMTHRSRQCRTASGPSRLWRIGRARGVVSDTWRLDADVRCPRVRVHSTFGMNWTVTSANLRRAADRHRAVRPVSERCIAPATGSSTA